VILDTGFNDLAFALVCTPDIDEDVLPVEETESSVEPVSFQTDWKNLGVPGG